MSRTVKKTEVAPRSNVNNYGTRLDLTASELRKAASSEKNKGIGFVRDGGQIVRNRAGADQPPLLLQ
jgi:hypothetical protein